MFGGKRTGKCTCSTGDRVINYTKRLMGNRAINDTKYPTETKQSSKKTCFIGHPTVKYTKF